MKNNNEMSFYQQFKIVGVTWVLQLTRSLFNLFLHACTEINNPTLTFYIIYNVN